MNLKSKSTKELKFLLATGIKGKEYISVLKEYMRRALKED